MALGLTHGCLGNKKSAIEYGQEGLDLLPLEKDHLLGLDVMYGMMRIYALLGENDGALNIMSKLLSLPCYIRGYFFTINPEFSGLWSDDRFDALIDKQNRITEVYLKN